MRQRHSVPLGSTTAAQSDRGSISAVQIPAKGRKCKHFQCFDLTASHRLGPFGPCALQSIDSARRSLGATSGALECCTATCSRCVCLYATSRTRMRTHARACVCVCLLVSLPTGLHRIFEAAERVVLSLLCYAHSTLLPRTPLSLSPPLPAAHTLAAFPPPTGARSYIYAAVAAVKCESRAS